MKRKITTSILIASISMLALTGCGSKATTNTTTENTGIGEAVSTVVEQITEATDNVKDPDDTTVDNSDDTSATINTVAYKLADEFNATTDKDCALIADSLSKSDVFKDISMGTMDVEPGLLTGFDSEINGFTKGTMFSPMIGSMPFVGYVFETDDPDALVKTLEENAQLNWNICTAADEMHTATKDNLVFFVMSPVSFED